MRNEVFSTHPVTDDSNIEPLYTAQGTNNTFNGKFMTTISLIQQYHNFNIAINLCYN